MGKTLRTVAIIQARMMSTRLPGKIMEDVCGKPMLSRVVDRVSKSILLDDVVVATSTKPYDDVVHSMCEKNGWNLFRGSEDDVLDRYYQTAKAFNVDAIVRVTADCPLIDPGEIDRVIREYKYNATLDYVSNVVYRTFPRGLDTELITLRALERIWKCADRPEWRENVTLYVLHHKENFFMRNISCGIDLSKMRWTVDEERDLEFVREVYKHFPDDNFSWHDVFWFLYNNPEIVCINKDVEQKVH
jgi:spore coat polysaccharide biosynthesis protein SpsF